MEAGTGESCGLPDGALHDLMTLLYYDMRRMLFTLRLFNFIFLAMVGLAIPYGVLVWANEIRFSLFMHGLQSI